MQTVAASSLASEAEAAVAAMEPQSEMRGEALLLKARLLMVRDPAAAVAFAGSLLQTRTRAHFRAEALIVLGNGLIANRRIRRSRRAVRRRRIGECRRRRI